MTAAVARFFALAVLLLPSLALAFGFDDVDRRAAQLAAKAYVEPKRGDLPKVLRDLSYDQYRDIRFRNSRSLWHVQNLPFEVAFFHRGGMYDEGVKISEIVEGQLQRPLPFNTDDFDYGNNRIDRSGIGNIGFAGFRVHYNVNSPKYKDEVLVFLGATYFRALGKDQRYGLSARGLALDTGLSSGEEFPRFVEFWLERPEPFARELVIYALLDSKSVAGAYRFALRPGTDTVVGVKARIYARRPIAKPGIAPLTSMYLFGENDRSSSEDYRPEVHDSDGLSVQSGTGEWLWRPLVNPRRLQVSSFELTNPLGFGLMQRDRNFPSYEDLEARYDLRPSAWIRPTKPLGPGRVELVLIPSQFETNDNVVSFWVPNEPLQPGRPLSVEYDVLWQKNTEAKPGTAWVTQTRRGPGYAQKPASTVDFHIDFEGPMLKRVAEKSRLDAVFSSDANAEIVEKTLERHPVTGGARVSLKVKRVDPSKAVELRGFLRDENQAHSETWAYILPPD